MENYVIIGLAVLVVLLNTKVSVNIMSEKTGEKLDKPLSMSLLKNITGVGFSIKLTKDGVK